MIFSFQVRKLSAILSLKCLFFGSNRIFFSKVMIEISRKSNFPIEMYTISFLCSLLFFNLLYLEMNKIIFKMILIVIFLKLLLFNKILKLMLIHFAALLHKLRFQFFSKFKKTMILDFKWVFLKIEFLNKRTRFSR